MIGLLQYWMFTGKKLTQLDHIVIALTHLLSVDGDHVVVHPVAHRRVTVCYSRLRDLALVVRKLQIHTAAMYIKGFSQVFTAHSRALDMPARKTFAPWA